MAGNGSIQFLRGNSDKRKASNESLLPGQPFYEADTNRLYVGGVNGTSLKIARPIGEEQRVVIGSTNLSIEEFIEKCEAGSYISIGTEATIKRCINGRDYKIRLIGTSHDDLADQSGSSTTKAKTTWEFENIIGTSPLGLPFDYKEYDSSSNIYFPSNMQGFPLAVTLQSTLQDIFASLPPALQDGIKLVRKPCWVKQRSIGSGGSVDEGNYNVSQKLFLLSATEIGVGTSPSDGPVEGTAYSYYSGIGSGTSTRRVKKYYGESSGNYYWLRSPRLNVSYNWCGVGIDGNATINSTGSSNVNSYGGVAPAFCI